MRLLVVYHSSTTLRDEFPRYSVLPEYWITSHFDLCGRQRWHTTSLNSESLFNMLCISESWMYGLFSDSIRLGCEDIIQCPSGFSWMTVPLPCSNSKVSRFFGRAGIALIHVIFYCSRGIVGCLSSSFLIVCDRLYWIYRVS